MEQSAETTLIPQSGAAAIWRTEHAPDLEHTGSPPGDQVGLDTCPMHAWTCIWCSMEPPICGSCRPLTPPCPANGQIHVCACHSRQHTEQAA